MRAGIELANQVADAAGQVYHSARTWSDTDISKQMRPNLERVPMLAQLHSDGSASFSNGRRIDRIDSVIYCTGYNYKYRLLEHLDLIRTGALLLLFMPVASLSGPLGLPVASLGYQPLKSYWVPSARPASHSVLSADMTVEHACGAAEDQHVHPLYRHIFVPSGEATRCLQHVLLKIVGSFGAQPDVFQFALAHELVFLQLHLHWLS